MHFFLGVNFNIHKLILQPPLKSAKILVKRISPQGRQLLISPSRWNLPRCDACRRSKSCVEVETESSFLTLGAVVNETNSVTGGKTVRYEQKAPELVERSLSQPLFPRSRMKFHSTQTQQQRHLNHVYLQNCVS